jgi:hypothetical protein
MQQLTPLNDLLPDYYDDIIEPHELAKAEQPQLDALEAAISAGQASQSVITADSAALSVYESSLGIIPRPGEDLDTRRYDVLMEVLPPQPLTEPYLRQVLALLNINAALNIDGPHFRVDVVASATDKGSTQRLGLLLNNYLPTNLTYTHSMQTASHVYTAAFAQRRHMTVTVADGTLGGTHVLSTNQYAGQASRRNHKTVSAMSIMQPRTVVLQSTAYFGAAVQRVGYHAQAKED